MIFHFMQQNPPALNSLPGYLLYLLVAMVLVGELYWWAKTSQQRQFKNLGFFIGLMIILLYFIFGYLVFFAK